jgi:hypothetical protein
MPDRLNTETTMALPFFGKPKRSAAQKQAKAEYEEVVANDENTRTARALRVRAGSRAKVFVDKTFVSAADKAVAWDARRVLVIAQGEEPPEMPQASEYQTINSVNGELVVYLPMEYAEQIFKIGFKYQLTEISAKQAVELAQNVADAISYDLRLEKPFTALEFLREELAEEGEDENAGSGGDTAGPGQAPQNPSSGTRG